MAIGRTFKEALQKGMRSLEIGAPGLGSNFRKVFYCFYDLMSANNNNVASFYEKSEKSILKVLDNLYTKIIENQSID
jgi:hypothetical protein